MWLLLLLFCGSQARVCDEIPETFTALTWHNLRKSPDLFRCLYDLETQAQFLSAWYFSHSGKPREVAVQGAELSVWLNPDMAEHVLLYRLGQRQQLLRTAGLELKAEQFEHVELCNQNLSTSCRIMEVSPEDVPCIQKEEGCKARLAQLVLELHAESADAEPLAFCSPVLGRPQELILKLKHPEAQCLASRCLVAETQLNYWRLVACGLQSDRVKSVSMLVLVLVYCFLVIGVVADSYLVPALCRIGSHLRLSDAMLGATLLALGGSITDLMTGLVSVLAGEEDSEPDVSLWLGGLVGAGLFATTFVASLVPLAAEAQVEATSFSRDLGFRSLANALVIGCAVLGICPVLYAMAMIACYGLYVLATLRDAAGKEDQEPESQEQPASFTRHSVSFLAHSGSFMLPEVPVVEDERCSVRLKRLLGYPKQGFMERLNFVAALPLRPFFCLTMASSVWDRWVNVVLPLGMCLFIPFGNPLGNAYSNLTRSAEVSILGLALLGTALSLRVGQLARQRPREYVGFIYFQWGTFLTSLLWIGLIAGEIVGALTVLGALMGLSPTSMGLTLLALGNSIDNVFATLGLCGSGQATVAITGIYAADAFTMLCVCGSILLLLSLKSGHAVAVQFTPCALVLLVTIQVVLAATWFCTRQNAWRLPRRLGQILMATYPLALVLGFSLEAVI